MNRLIRALLHDSYIKYKRSRLNWQKRCPLVAGPNMGITAWGTTDQVSELAVQDTVFHLAINYGI